MTTASDWDATTLTLDELCEQTGVTVRTVRYYIAEGLLPPPIGHGTSARYSGEHLDRLTAIAALKDRFLPLREIRRTLSGLEPEAIASMAEQARGQMDHGVALSAPAPQVQSAPAASPARFKASPPADAGQEPDISAYIDRVLNQPATANRRRSSPPVPEPDEATAWMRVRISDEAELLIEADRYHRHEAQIAALVAWAQRILK